MEWRSLSWFWTLAVAVRLVLLLLGTGEWLLWRPEVSTPANTVLKAREGLWLLQYGLSPYHGGSCHTPPLWLAVSAPFSQHKLLYAVPNILCDLVAAAAVLLASTALFKPCLSASHKRDAPWLSPEQLSVLYLFNPFTVLTCVAGTTTSAENMAIILAVAGGVRRKGPLAGFGVALGAYMGLHPVLLTLPLMMLIYTGAEDVLRQVPAWPLIQEQQQRQQRGQLKHGDKLDAEDLNDAGDDETVQRGRHKQERTAAAADALHQQDEPLQKLQQETTGCHQQTAAACSHGSVACWLFAAAVALCAVALLTLSDSVLQQHPAAQCLPAAVTWLKGKLLGVQVKHVMHQLSNSCWIPRVYRFSLLLEDYTPTIGLWWYFFTEMFDAFRPFFLFVFHSFAVVLATPMVLRFPKRPLFVAWVQLYISCMFKPYACVGDLVPWMTLLPLLQQQLQCMKLGLFFVNSFLLLVVLGPAMWHQWIVVDAANSNFFYSITLLLGVWYTVFLVQMLRFTVLLDRRLAGKDHLMPAVAVHAPTEAAKAKDE